ncbi:neuroglian-like [Macrobrachium nipponense]|uniref:neuroglian-like n=1 Tax=Macrobrachium nipponense TaxID=159736 RepID=UPI0030C82BA4
MTFLFLLQLCALHTVLTKKAYAAPASDQSGAPRPPHLDAVDCKGREAIIKWVTGSGDQPTLSYSVYHRESRAYCSRAVRQMRRHVVDAAFFRIAMPLIPFTNNSFWVTGQNDAGISDPSKMGSCSVPPELPSRNPPDVKVSRLVLNVLTVTWTVVPREDHNGPGFQYLVSWQRWEAEEGETEQKLLDLRSSDNGTSGDSNHDLLQENGEDIDEESGSSYHDSEEDKEEEEDLAEENVNAVVGNQEKIRGKKQNKWGLKEIKDWTKNETEIEVDPNYSYLIKVESWNDLGRAPNSTQPITSIRVPASITENSTIGQAISIFNKTESLPLKHLNGSHVA